jgi:hypothetical protein
MYMEGGRRVVRMGLQGGGGVQGPRGAARGLWVGQQVSVKLVQHL